MEGRKKNAKRLADNGDFLAQVNNILQASIFYFFFCPFWFSLPLLIIFTVILQASTSLDLWFEYWKRKQWNNVYHRWSTNNFQCKWYTSTTSGSKSSPREIFHRNSSVARTPTWNSPRTTKEPTSTRNGGTERTSFSTAKATPTTRGRTPDRRTEEQEIGISESLWSFYTVENPHLLVFRFPRRYIDKSLQSFSSYYGLKYNDFHANCTAIFVLFFFSKSGGRNNAKYSFQYSFKNNTTQYARRCSR